MLISQSELHIGPGDPAVSFLKSDSSAIRDALQKEQAHRPIENGRVLMVSDSVDDPRVEETALNITKEAARGHADGDA